MTIQRTKGQSSKGGLAILLNNVNGTHSYLESKGQGAKIVDFGGGLGNEGDITIPNTYSNILGAQSQLDQVGGFGTSYGEWTIIPTRTFNATVKAWGGGGGNHSHGQNASGGGGGHARSQITFLQDIPYTFWVGQGGSYTLTRYGTNGNRHNYRTSGTFGNGGGGGHTGGSGGGLSGIFFNTLGFESQGSGHNSQGYGADHEYGGVSTWFRTPSQNNALLIAGGGGGTGHSHTSSHHGQGGGGGGTAGNVGHNAGGGTQTAGGSGGYSSAQAGHALHGGSGGNSTLGGGGGGGWFGGGGGGHSGSHYNGGGGGSGHALDLNSTVGYRNYWIRTTYGDIAKNSYIETSPSDHSNTVNMAAGRTDADWAYAGIGAGFRDVNNNLDTNKYLGYSDGYRSGNNGRIVIRVNE